MSDRTLETTLVGNAGPLNAALEAGARGIQEFTADAVAANKAQTTATSANTAALNALTEAMRKVKTEGEKSGETFRKQKTDVEALGTSAKQTAAAMRGLPAQFTDIATQLQGGASPFTVLLQQGGQIKDQFGGVKPMFEGLLSLMTPLRVGMGLFGGAAIAAAVAAKQGADETRALNGQLALMGPTASYTAGRVLMMGDDIARATGEPIGQVRELLTELLKLQGVGNAALTDGVRAGLALQRLSGQTASEVAEQFAGLGNGAAAWATKMNAAYGFMTAAQIQQVQALEAQGQKGEAVRLVMAALAGTMEQRLGPTMSWLDKQIQEHNGFWSKLWDTLKGIGRDTSVEERIAAWTEKLAEVETKGIPVLDALALRLAPNSQWGKEGAAKAAQVRAVIQAEIDAYTQGNNRTLLLRAEATAAAKTEQGKVEQMSAAHQAALAAIEKAGAAGRLAAATVDLARRQAATELAFQRTEITAKQHQDNLLKIELGRINAQEAQLSKLIQIEAARKPANDVDAMQRQATLLTLEAQRTALAEKRVKLLSDEARGLRDITPNVIGTDPRDALRSFKAQDERNVEDALKQRRGDSDKGMTDLVAANKAAAVTLIKDDRARGMAQIALDEEVIKRRLDLNGMADADRQRAEEALATWRVQREQQLTEQLKPEWQKQLEAWQDTTKLMKEATDSFMSNFNATGERTFAEFFRTGKVNIKAFGNMLADEMGRLAWRSMMGNLSGGSGGMNLSGLFNMALGWFGMGSPSAASSPSSMYALPSSGIKFGNVTGGGATGTNELQRDMITLVHKGEAIVPKAFNPWAGGGSGAGLGGGGNVNQNITYNVPPGMSPAAYASALEANNRRLKAEMVGDMLRNGRPANRAAALSRL